MSGNSAAMPPRGAERAGRITCFRIFRDIAKDTFQQLASADLAHGELARIASFHVLPGGRDGGNDERIVDVFYGNRAIGRDFHAPGQRRIAAEQGAMLRYTLGDDGSVLCTLYPAGSSNRQRTEEAILYRLIRNPCVLTGPPVLERHRRTLRSYFECTSVDGRPTTTDRLRVGWLLLTRKAIIEGKTAPPLWRRGANKAIAIGMSGSSLLRCYSVGTSVPENNARRAAGDLAAIKNATYTRPICLDDKSRAEASA